jgi:hypothetical protein
MYGKRIFVWQVLASGSIEEVIRVAKEGKFQGLDFKVIEGPYPYVVVGKNNQVIPNLSAADAAKVRAAGFDVGGWGPIYGNDPVSEANAIIAQITQLNLSSFILDVEGHFENQPNRIASATLICNKIKTACPNVKLGFCGFACYKNPTTGGTWHPVEMFRTFMALCDFGMPMMYWYGTTVDLVLKQLRDSGEQWRAIAQGKPIIPAGRAYTGDGGTPLPETVLAFEAEAHKQYLGITWWDLQQAVPIAAVWKALCNTPKFDMVAAGNQLVSDILAHISSWMQQEALPEWAEELLKDVRIKLQNKLNGV